MNVLSSPAAHCAFRFLFFSPLPFEEVKKRKQQRAKEGRRGERPEITRPHRRRPICENTQEGGVCSPIKSIQAHEANGMKIFVFSFSWGERNHGFFIHSHPLNKDTAPPAHPCRRIPMWLMKKLKERLVPIGQANWLFLQQIPVLHRMAVSIASRHQLQHKKKRTR